jgi:beta-mannosidase
MDESTQVKTLIVNWSLAQLDPGDIDHSLANASWRPVMIPNVVQASPFSLPKDELYRLENTEQVQWMSACAWAYCTALTLPEITPDREGVLCFHGLDYTCDIRIDGKVVCQHEGMFSTVEVPLSHLPAGNHTVVVVFYPPTDFTKPLREHAKARFSIGWDWAPRLVTMGIWNDVEWVVRPKLHIRHAWVETHLTNAQRADCLVQVRLSERVSTGRITVRLAGIEQTFPIVDTDSLRLPVRILNPPLWWPNGCGQPALVDLQLDLAVDGRLTAPFTLLTGLREVRRSPADGQRLEDIPLQLVINGRKVFIRGANWTPADSCISELGHDRYALFLRQLAAAGFNLLRVWGGGLIEKEAFYDLADELGLMIMQEFPLACEFVPETEKFLHIINAEARAFIPRLNRHPSIAFWTGGNEHYHYWDALDSGTPIMEASKGDILTNEGLGVRSYDYRGGVPPYENLGLKHIASLVAELDGSRPFQPTSGMEGEGEPHGIWNWDPKIGDQRMRDYATLYDYWNDQREHFYSEASVEGIANRQAIEYVTCQPQPEVPQPGDPVWQHHKAFNACWQVNRAFNPDPRSTLWLDLASLDRLFGRFDNLDDLITASQWLQGEGGRYLVTELRRKMPHTCGVIWWGANEPWPNLAGNQLIDYFGQPRPALKVLANAFKPTILSLRYPHCVAHGFKPELWISHDGEAAFHGRYEVIVVDIGSTEQERYQGAVTCAAYSSVFIKMLRYRRLNTGTHLKVQCSLVSADGMPVHSEQYLFASSDDPAPLRPLLELMRTFS